MPADGPDALGPPQRDATPIHLSAPTQRRLPGGRSRRHCPHECCDATAPKSRCMSGRRPRGHLHQEPTCSRSRPSHRARPHSRPRPPAIPTVHQLAVLGTLTTKRLPLASPATTPAGSWDDDFVRHDTTARPARALDRRRLRRRGRHPITSPWGAGCAVSLKKLGGPTKPPVKRRAMHADPAPTFTTRLLSWHTPTTAEPRLDRGCETRASHESDPSGCNESPILQACKVRKQCGGGQRTTRSARPP